MKKSFVLTVQLMIIKEEGGLGRWPMLGSEIDPSGGLFLSFNSATISNIFCFMFCNPKLNGNYLKNSFSGGNTCISL